MFEKGDTVSFTPSNYSVYNVVYNGSFQEFPFKGFIHNKNTYTKSFNDGSGFHRFEFDIVEKNYSNTGKRKKHYQTVYIYGLIATEILSTKFVLLEKYHLL